MACIRIHSYTGDMSTKIVEIVNRKLQEKIDVKLLVDKDIKLAYGEYINAKNLMKAKFKSFEELLKDKHLSFSQYSDKESINDIKVNTSECLIPKDDLKQLQRATDLWNVNKKREAKAIWDLICNTYEIK